MKWDTDREKEREWALWSIYITVKITSVFLVDHLNRVRQSLVDIVRSNNHRDRNGISVVLLNHLVGRLDMGIDFYLLITQFGCIQFNRTNKWKWNKTKTAKDEKEEEEERNNMNYTPF